MKFSKLIYSCTGLLIGTAITMGVAIQPQAHELGFSMAKMRVGDSVPKSITGKPGDAKKGRAKAIHRKRGNCLACHALPVPEQADHGNIGPDLAGVGSRYSAGEIRMRIIDPKTVNPDTIMPAFYKNIRLHRVQKKWQGKTILSAQDIEDIIAYLVTLK